MYRRGDGVPSSIGGEMGCSSTYRRGGEMVDSRTSWLIWGPPLILSPHA